MRTNRFARSKTYIPLLASLLIGLSDVPLTYAAPPVEKPTEYAVKAAYLLKFAAFVEWPQSTFNNANSPLVIGIIGDDPFGEAIDHMAARHLVSGRKVVIIRSKQIGKIDREDILFVSQSEQYRMDLIAKNLTGKKVLTVAEFDDPQIIIRFVIENDKVRFDINLAQAQRSDLKLSSKLLNVARYVIKE